MMYAESPRMRSAYEWTYSVGTWSRSFEKEEGLAEHVQYLCKYLYSTCGALQATRSGREVSPR